MRKRLRLHLFFRKPDPALHFSIERLYSEVMAHLSRERFDVRVLICPYSSRGVVRRFASMIWAALNQGDINHVTGDTNYLAIFMLRRRTLLTIHDSASMIRLNGIARRVYRLIWIELPMRRSSVVTVVSESSRRELNQLVGGTLAARVRVVPNCVTFPIFNSSAPGGGQARPVCLVIGTRPHKNVQRVIEAASGLTVTLRIIGEIDVTLGKELESRSVQYENYTKVDNQSIIELYRTSDLVVFVPTYEGFGLPILEAQAAGVPLITSARSPMREVAGDGACLVDPENVDEIRSAIAKVIRDSGYANGLVQAGARNVAQFQPANIAMMYERLYLLIAQEYECS